MPETSLRQACFGKPFGKTQNLSNLKLPKRISSRNPHLLKQSYLTSGHLDFFVSQYPRIDELCISKNSENLRVQNKRSHKSIIRLYILKKCNPTISLSHEDRISTIKNITTWVEGSIKNKIIMTIDDIQNMLLYNKILPSTTGLKGYFLVPQDFNVFVEYLRCTIISIIHQIPVRNRNNTVTSEAVGGGSTIQNNIPVPIHSQKINVRLSLEMENFKRYEIMIMKTQDIKNSIQDYANTFLTTNKKHDWSQLRIRQSEILQVHPDILQIFPSSYFTQETPTHINQSEINEKTEELSTRLSIFFNNSNKKQNASYNELEEETENSNDRNVLAHDFVGAFVFLSPTEVFDLIYFIGNFSLFDVGFQVETINLHSKETSAKSVVDLIFQNNKNSVFLAHKDIDPSCERFSDLWQFNTCPFCDKHDTLFETVGINKPIKKQFKTSQGRNCRPTKYSNYGLYNHLASSSTTCWLHHIFMKYIEIMYPRKLWDSDTNGNSLQRQNKKCKIDEATGNMSELFELYSLTR